MEDYQANIKKIDPEEHRKITERAQQLEEQLAKLQQEAQQEMEKHKQELEEKNAEVPRTPPVLRWKEGQRELTILFYYQLQKTRKYATNAKAQYTKIFSERNQLEAELKTEKEQAQTLTVCISLFTLEGMIQN